MQANSGWSRTVQDTQKALVYAGLWTCTDAFGRVIYNSGLSSLVLIERKNTCISG
jgi:hypothetical protein